MRGWFADNSLPTGGAPLVTAGFAERPENRGKTLVAAPPDSGERYLCSASFEGLFGAKGVAA